MGQQPARPGYPSLPQWFARMASWHDVTRRFFWQLGPKEGNCFLKSKNLESEAGICFRGNAKYFFFSGFLSLDRAN
jgi:hypothetical protein